jgi:hypothetical protein
MMILAKKRHSATLKDIKPAVMTVEVGLTPKIYTVLKYLPNNRENQ